MNLKWKIGDCTITRIREIEYPEFSDVIPAATPDVVKQVPWLFPHFVTPEGALSLSIHMLVIETPNNKLVVDTCIGNERDRNPFEVMHMLQTSFMDDFKAAGFKTEEIDYVLCTHLHLDHVGWNTYKKDGKWVPTFPNASYLWGKGDQEFWGNLPKDSGEDFIYGVFDRDGGRCAYVAPDGTRCGETRFLELHHAGVPFSLGRARSLGQLFGQILDQSCASPASCTGTGSGGNHQ